MSYSEKSKNFDTFDFSGGGGEVAEGGFLRTF